MIPFVTFSSSSLLLPSTLIALIFIVCNTNALTKCVRASGRLFCVTDQKQHAHVSVTLWDHDGLPWESNDQMGHTWTDADGRFVVQGCANDFGPFNSPDPFIEIEHYCQQSTVIRSERDYYQSDIDNETSKAQLRQIRIVNMRQTFLPTEINVGLVRIDVE